MIALIEDELGPDSSFAQLELILASSEEAQPLAIFKIRMYLCKETTGAKNQQNPNLLMYTHILDALMYRHMYMFYYN